MYKPLFFIILSLLVSRDSFEAVQVRINQGTLEGVVSTSRNGSQFYSFYGIPFAKPPVGELRFEAPKEADHWQGAREAKKPPPVCIQSFNSPFYSSNIVIVGEEDCLYLNVFTSDVNSSSLLPVMVFIHGGAFSFGGSAKYGPEYFMDHSLVVVTIQYRLAIFGFLSASDEVLPGNYGMKDQVAALKWVQTNIAAFGGDPKRVTIVGESAGAASVHLHLHSSQSTGLFHQAICQSGSALAVWSVINSRTAEQRARALGVLLGCPELETKALVECLRKIPAQQLVSAHEKFLVYDSIPPVRFGPVVEPKSMPDAFLIENPWKQNVINDVPFMTALTSDEGGLFTTRFRSLPMVMNEWTHHYERLLPIALSYFDRADVKNVSATTAAIKNFYFGDKNISVETRKNISSMFMDGFFAATALEAAQRINSTVFFYLYDHRNEHTLSERTGNVTDELGVTHGDDLFSYFSLKNVFPPIKQGPTTDYAVSQRMVKFLVNFIRNGDPNGERKIWRPFKSDDFAFLHIKTESDDMEEKFRYDKYVFWKDVLFPV